MRRLIVNADDFGLTSGVNRGIIEAHSQGIVTSSTLMACGAQFEKAVSLARETPTLSVGCHVLLVDGPPALDVRQVSTLASTNSGTPRFCDSLVRFAYRAATGRLDEDQIESEITAQVRKIQAVGIQVSHLDSHKHTHMFPAVFRPMLRAAKKCGVRAIRNPFEPLLFAGTGNWKRRFQLGILRSFRSSFQQVLKESGMTSPDGCIGIIATGGLDLDTFRRLMENLPTGTWEFVSHPGHNDIELANIKTRLRASREKELEVLTSPRVREILRREQIDLISYRDYVEAAGNPLEVPAPSSFAGD